MGATKWTLALALTVGMTVTGAAQQHDSASLNLDFPIPAWPANGVVPADMKDHYVFVDLAKNEYIVAYPENLGSPDFEKNGPSAQRFVTRYPLQRSVDPKVSVALAPSNGGKFKYTYTVTDGPAAKQSIDQWLLVLPENAEASIKQPAGWFGVLQKERKVPLSDSNWLKSGKAVIFAYDKTEEQIQPGAKKAGFELESDLKPGFTAGFFRPQESLEATVQMSGNIPDVVVKNATPPPPAGGAPAGGGGGGFGGGGAPAGATTAWQPIKDDVEKIQNIEFNSKAVLTLAPKFDKTASDKAIASDFMQGITFLSKSGGLSADSAFVKSTLSDLDAYVKAGGNAALKLSAQPNGPAETEIFNAMKISLHTN